jgi:hypothetical protein
MAIVVFVHIMNDDPIMGEVEQLPGPADTNILLSNPRRRDGKDIPNLMASVTQVIWPMHRVAFIEVLPGEEEEQIIGFVRE